MQDGFPSTRDLIARLDFPRTPARMTRYATLCLSASGLLGAGSLAATAAAWLVPGWKAALALPATAGVAFGGLMLIAGSILLILSVARDFVHTGGVFGTIADRLDAEIGHDRAIAALLARDHPATDIAAARRRLDAQIKRNARMETMNAVLIGLGTGINGLAALLHPRLATLPAVLVAAAPALALGIGIGGVMRHGLGARLLRLDYVLSEAAAIADEPVDAD